MPHRMLSDGRGKETPVYAAAYRGNHTALQFLLEEGSCPNQAKKTGYTPACISAWMGDVRALKLLAVHGADLDKSMNNGWAPVELAAQYNKPDALRFLINKGVRTNGTVDGKAYGPTFYASKAGSFDALKVLHILAPLPRGGRQEIIAAVEAGHDDIVFFLATHGADINGVGFWKLSDLTPQKKNIQYMVRGAQAYGTWKKFMNIEMLKIRFKVQRFGMILPQDFGKQRVLYHFLFGDSDRAVQLNGGESVVLRAAPNDVFSLICGFLFGKDDDIVDGVRPAKKRKFGEIDLTEE